MAPKKKSDDYQQSDSGHHTDGALSVLQIMIHSDVVFDYFLEVLMGRLKCITDGLRVNILQNIDIFQISDEKNGAGKK